VTTDLEWGQFHTSPYQQKPYASRPMEFVRCCRQCCGTKSSKADRDFADSLNSIEQQRHLRLKTMSGEDVWCLDDSCFVMSQQQAGKSKFSPWESFDGLIVHLPAGINRNGDRLNPRDPSV